MQLGNDLNQLKMTVLKYKCLHMVLSFELFSLVLSPLTNWSDLITSPLYYE